MNFRFNQQINNIGSKQDFTDHYEINDLVIFGIYDGHTGIDIVKTLAKGIEGKISPFCKFLGDKLSESIPDEDSQLHSYFFQNIIQFFHDYDRLLLESFKYTRSGSTASILIIYKNHAFIANIGDSNVVILSNGSIIDTTFFNKIVKSFI